jgi:serine/threonine protein kinase/predicted ATPase
MSNPTTPPPATLGRYRVLRRLGAGGMAEVFLAKSTGAEGLEKVLVVKRILEAFARSPKFLAMFVDEAKLALRLNHPNIVQVYAFEQVKDELLLAMEYVDGMDLGRLVSAAKRRNVRVPYAIAALVVAEVAKGLDYAHNRKDEAGVPMDIVHRDVSPQNVLVSHEGAVKIADFGIARARMITEETGIIKGKFSYMSPEQARGARVDRRSDVYSLGVMLAELLMGRAMYPGLQGMEVLEQVRDGKYTRPSAIDPNVPEELEQIAVRAMAFDREERFQTARSLAGALSRWLHQQPEVVDLGALEHFVSDLAPREPTVLASVPEGVPRPVDETMLSMPSGLPSPGQREVRERRGVVVVSGVLRQDEGVAGEGSSADADKESSAEARFEQAASVLGDIAFKYDAILEWPGGAKKRAFRLILGVGKTTVDDPLHACRLALDVLEALSGLSADAISPLHASLGLSRGALIVVRGGQARARHEPADEVFDVAARLASEAGLDEVLASGEVFRLARRIFSFADERREIEVKDGTKLRAHRLVGARTRDERAEEQRSVVRQAGLFGRAHELEAIEEVLREAVATKKSGQLLVIGELGVGKTALVTAALARGVRAGSAPSQTSSGQVSAISAPSGGTSAGATVPSVLRVDCAFGSAEVPYAAVADLVREALGISESTPPETALGQLRDRLRKILPPLDRQKNALAAFEPLLSLSRRESEAGDRALLLTRAVRDLLGALAGKGPTVLWVDSAQFIDEPSRDILVRLATQSHDRPLLVVISSRPDPRLEEGLRGIPRIDLGELDETDRRALIAAHFSVQGGAVQGGAGSGEPVLVPPDVIQAIVTRAGGNPFFLEELLDALLERGTIAIEETPAGERRVVRRGTGAIALPASLEDVIAARVAELSDRERVTLRWLAVAGAGLREHQVTELMGVEAKDSLKELEERGLVARRDGGTLSFASGVVRQVAYESADPADRARMHRRVAAYLSGLPANIAPARIAKHHELAFEPIEAARQYRAAGTAARAVYSNKDALRFFARALELLPETAAERFEIHAEREQILRVMSRRGEQRLELEAMRQIAERLRDPARIAVAFARLARCDLDAARPTGVEAMLRRALDASIEAGARAAEVESLRLLGQLRRDLGDTEGALEAFDRALARAGLEQEHLSARGMTLVQKASLLWRAGAYDRAIESAAEGLAIARRLGHKGHQASALNLLGVSLASQGELEDAIACIRASIVLDRAAGDRIYVGRKCSNVGQMHAELGDTERALELIHRALEVFDRADDLPARTDTLSALGEILFEQKGDVEGAKRALDEAQRIATRLNDPNDMAHERVVRAELHRWLGDHPEAARAADEATQLARAAGTAGYELLGRALHALSLAELGRRDEARAQLDEAERATRSGPIERGERVLGALARTARLLGDRDRAERLSSAADAIVSNRATSLRDPLLRERYLASPVVRAVREELPR